MKHIMASLTIGACLLLTSAGASVFAADKKPQITGQPGSASGTTCQSLPPGSTPGNSAGAGGSPFNPNNLTKHYAGNLGNPTFPAGGTPGDPAVGSNANTATAISEYDVACANQAAKAAR
jgi:hypothetical protein